MLEVARSIIARRYTDAPRRIDKAVLAAQLHQRQAFRESVRPIELRFDDDLPGAIDVAELVAGDDGRKAFAERADVARLQRDDERARAINATVAPADGEHTETGVEHRLANIVADHVETARRDFAHGVECLGQGLLNKARIASEPVTK